MRRRIVLSMVPVIALLVLGVGIPYAILVSERATQRVFVDRTGDAVRFASEVDAAIESGESTGLGEELASYSALYDSAVWVLALDGATVHDPGVPLPDDEEFASAVRRAFAGGRVSEAPTVYPWTAAPLRVVEPVGRDSQVTAVVVIEAPTDKLRAGSLSQWAVGIGVLVVAVAGLLVGLWPLTSWILRPVRDLERSTAGIGAGDFTTRADVDRGPQELRELSESFNTMADTVERSMERQRAFVTDAAHQLRNPLASLRLAVENLRPWLRDGDAREAHEDAVAETVELGATFEAMLGAVSAERESGELGGDLCSVVDVFEAARPQWQACAESAGVRLVIDDPGREGRTVRQPSGGLVAVLDELVSNAARLSGGTTVTVRMRTECDGRWAVFEVVDDGRGLSESELTAATGRFWRAPRHQNVAGTGLGLAIVGDVVADVGGTFELRGVPGGGTVARLRLACVTE
ncbi:sensor histidine kinase [Rhodococcus sp. 14-2470-1b]|nr:HAMP domain-containing sensor histidine kinase [Rhodococcus sp. 14-2470-1b]OZF05474.1 sensor histidine kinase [Rhodococcus sp. 15-1189-1-1a]OZF20257.1 sensor histidine kinase [Rhodococcus sp. 14-2686-1-2]OZF56374.1 sensor histidine kinase [Rhodococcus sp. 14-2470-1b]